MYGESELEKDLERNWYDSYFKWITIGVVVFVILFQLIGGGYCDLAPGAPYC